MNTLWSDCVQTSEELYESRSLRFRPDNADVWLPSLHAENGMDALEIGCAGGLLLHRVKQLIPGIKATGLDRDDNHISFAKAKTKELGLECDFVVGDATDLPFPDNTFDLTFSHTVMEHVETGAFLREQYRVLKPGGRIVVLAVRTRLNLRAESWKSASGEEQMLFDKLWAGVGKDVDEELKIAAFEMDERDYPAKWAEFGFSKVDVRFFTGLCYAPDNESVSDELAERQIGEMRLSTLESVRKALARNPDGLNAGEREALIALINERYDERLARYRRGEKLWDMVTNTVMSVTGLKL